MKKELEYIQNEFKDDPDLVIKHININPLHKVYIFYLESLCSQDKINEYILRRITSIKNLPDFESDIPGSKIKKLKGLTEAEKYLYDGYTVIFDNKHIYAIETKADINRGLSTNENEPAINGPKNAFIENYQTNLGLIKRRLKTKHFKTKNLSIGKLANNNVGILYLDNVAKKENVDKVYDILSKIDIDILNSSESLIKYLSESKDLFPTVITTERPDRCAEALAEGKIVIMCDNSPTALIVPAFLIDFINPFTDKYNNSYNINFTKLIRMLCFICSIVVPAFYIAIINYNQEAIPTSLIINFASQRSKIPFPALVECIVMLIICEILRESDIRFPSKYGSAASLLGALVLGDAAVSAGLVSPIMIIICSFTYVASLIFTDPEISNMLRYYRFFLIFLASFLGSYGLVLGVIFLFINLCDAKSIGYPYTFPLAPYDKAYFSEFILAKNNLHRSKKLSNNIIKERQ